jgi:hypothetical protein
MLQEDGKYAAVFRLTLSVIPSVSKMLAIKLTSCGEVTQNAVHMYVHRFRKLIASVKNSGPRQAKMLRRKNSDSDRKCSLPFAEFAHTN